MRSVDRIALVQGVAHPVTEMPSGPEGPRDNLERSPQLRAQSDRAHRVFLIAGGVHDFGPFGCPGPLLGRVVGGVGRAASPVGKATLVALGGWRFRSADLVSDCSPRL